MPIAYLALYIALRATGVYYAYFSQGSWEIDGGTNLVAIDYAFLPISLLEADIQNRLRWLPEPKGG